MSGRFEDRCRYLAVASRESYRRYGNNCYYMNLPDTTFYSLDVEEFEKLYDSELLWSWDEKYCIMLDDLDDGVIDSDLEDNLELVSDVIGDGSVKEAFKLAIDLGTAVYFFL